MKACYAELLARLVAAHIQNSVSDTTIYSNCQGAIKLVDSVVQGSIRPGVCKIRLQSVLTSLGYRAILSGVKAAERLELPRLGNFPG